MERSDGSAKDASTGCPEDVFLEMADDPEFVEAMRKAGASTVKSTPAQFQQEIEQWKPFLGEFAVK